MSFDSDVRWFTTLSIDGYSMSGMPRCSGTAGDLKGMLDVFLNTGTNLKTLTGLSRSGTTATATFSGSPGFIPDQVIQAAGASQTEWNDLYRVATVASNSITFGVPNTHTASPTGTITLKAASAGWTVADDGGNIYRAKSADPSMTGLTLWIDDSAATYARVRGWETWTGGVGSGPFPTDAQVNGGLYAYKSSASGTASRNYICIVDRGFIYLFIEYNQSSYADDYEPIVFGDFMSWMNGDSFGCLILAKTTTSSAPNQFNDFFRYSSTNPGYIARDSSLNPNSSIPYRCFGPSENTNYLGGAGYAYPNPLDGGDIAYAPIRIAQSSSIPRGQYPGLMIPLHAFPYQNGKILKDYPQHPGRKYIALKGYGLGNVLIDYIGPWR